MGFLGLSFSLVYIAFGIASCIISSTSNYVCNYTGSRFFPMTPDQVLLGFGITYLVFGVSIFASSLMSLKSNIFRTMTCVITITSSVLCIMSMAIIGIMLSYPDQSCLNNYFSMNAMLLGLVSMSAICFFASIIISFTYMSETSLFSLERNWFAHENKIDMA